MRKRNKKVFIVGGGMMVPKPTIPRAPEGAVVIPKPDDFDETIARDSELELVDAEPDIDQTGKKLLGSKRRKK